MEKGKLRKLFPGGNTSQGFFSFYHNIIEPDATRILVIKGGPGVGKSSFMRKIGETMLEKGFDVEYHCCSSDNGSLDGICIPAIRVAMLDGTAPHIVDPKNPGAVDEIINLGEFWDEAKMVANKKPILEINAWVSRQFKIAYCNLREAKVIRDEWESYITESMNWNHVNEHTASIINDVFQNVSPQYLTPAKARHLFASAISPDGPAHYYETILQDVENFYLVKGQPGSGKSTILQKVATLANQSGLATEVYNQPLDPNKLDLVLIPALKTAVINNAEPIQFNPAGLTNTKLIKAIDLDTCINNNTLQRFSGEAAYAKVRFWNSFNRAVQYLKKAKDLHDQLETYFFPAMNFESINRKRDETLQRILNWAMN